MPREEGKPVWMPTETYKEPETATREFLPQTRLLRCPAKLI